MVTNETLDNIYNWLSIQIKEPDKIIYRNSSIIYNEVERSEAKEILNTLNKYGFDATVIYDKKGLYLWEVHFNKSNDIIETEINNTVEAIEKKYNIEISFTWSFKE